MAPQSKNVKLPDDLCSFLLTSNGMMLTWRVRLNGR